MCIHTDRIIRAKQKALGVREYLVLQASDKSLGFHPSGKEVQKVIIHWSQGRTQSLWEGVALKVPMQKVPKRDSLRVL